MRPYKVNREKYQKAMEDYLTIPNCTLTFLQEKYGLDRRNLSKYFKSNNVNVKTKVYNKAFNDVLDKAIEDYVNSKNSMSKIAKKYGICKESLAKHLKQIRMARNTFVRQNYDINLNYFEDIDSEEKSYWLGFLLADGCIRLHGHNAQLTLELADVDYDHLVKFKNSIQYSGEIKNRKNRNISSICISKNQIAYDLMNKGVVPKKTQLGFVDLESISGFEAGFIRGYCDGNGSIDKTRTRITFTLGAIKIRDALIQLLEKYNPNSRTDSKLSGTGNPTYRIVIENKQGFYDFLKDVYLNASIFLDRKMLIVLNRLNAHYGQLLTEDHRKIMRNLAGTTCKGESETEGSTIK